MFSANVIVAPDKSLFPDRRGRPNYLLKTQLAKVKEIVLGSRLAGLAFRRDDVVSLEHALLMMTTHQLKENGGTVELTPKWASGVLQELIFSFRKATTDKRTPLPSFLKEAAVSTPDLHAHVKYPSVYF